ncbi:MAG: ATP-binding protein, partial [Candidatus Cryptobacteroides sp.]
MQEIGHRMLICSICLFLWASPLPAESFHPLKNSTGEDCPVFCVATDACGYLWLGTDEGLVRYDGYRGKTYRNNPQDSLSIVNNVVNALLFDGESGLLYVGTDSGLCVYDGRTDSFRNVRPFGGRHIKALLRHSGKIYVATTVGLTVLDCRTGDVSEITDLPSPHISSLFAPQGKLIAGSYGHIYVLSDGNADIHRIDALPLSSLVLSVCPAGQEDNLLYLGTESGLLLYDTDRRAVLSRRLDNLSVKTFFHIGPELWAGTDNGLYIFTEDGKMTGFRHIVGDSSSLPNDVVWSISEDCRGNIILGTDHGASIVETTSRFRYLPVNQFTDSQTGMDISTLRADDNGNLWLGGNNGLIRYNGYSGKGERFLVDGADRSKRVSHNKVRDICPDGEKIWIASDGGLDCYDCTTGRITHHHITEPTGRFSSKWMYSISKDDCGRLWLGTYDGGLFAVEADAVRPGNVGCALHLNTASAPAVSSNIVRHTVFCDGLLYAECGSSIDVIDLGTMQALRYDLPPGEFCLSFEEVAGHIIAGTETGIYEIRDGKVVRLAQETFPAKSLCRFRDRLMICSDNILYSYDFHSGSLEMEDTGGKPFLSVGVYRGEFYAGTVDGMMVENFSSVRPADESAVVICDFKVNEEYSPVSFWRGRDVVLPHSMNTFTVEFSDLRFEQAKSRFCYRLKGFDDKWRLIREGENSANFLNIPSGNYSFEAARASVTGEPLGDAAVMNIRIRPFWYATPLAFVIYFIIFIGLVLWIAANVRMKHQLQIVKVEREKALEAADSKTRLLDGISKEFGGELATIKHFVDRIGYSESDSLKSGIVRDARKSAEKMHILLEKMSDYNKEPELYIPSFVNLEELAREVWDGFVKDFEDRQINFRFVAEKIGYIFIADRLQLGNVFRTLLSNSLKSTPEGGSILMSLNICRQDKDMLWAQLKFEDTGRGIPEEELPMIFNKFYSAPSGYNAVGDGQVTELHNVKT